MSDLAEYDLIKDMKQWRPERPDEWTMDRFILGVEQLQSELAEAREANRWVPVDEVLPETGEKVLVWDNTFREAYCDFDPVSKQYFFKEISIGYRLSSVTHWKPITAPE